VAVPLDAPTLLAERRLEDGPAIVLEEVERGRDAQLLTSVVEIGNVAPQRRPFFLGTHYFSPVSRMKLVEVIPQFDTSEETVATTTRLCAGAGKTPIRVKDVAGFAVNRALHAFMIEAIRLVEEGVVGAEDFDTACKLGLGHAVGPFELMDQVTSSLCLQVQEILQDAYGERFRPPALLKQRVKAGYLGRKAGRGWLKSAERKK